jgi:TetR/AcrR family transcriptional repressor of nem operon
MARTKAFNEDQILDKAVELFWRQGYHATSIQDVVDTLRINRASLYGTYGDKHTLFVRALQRYRSDQAQVMVRFVQGPGSPLDKIKALLNRTAKATLSDREQKGCFLINSAMELVNQDPEIARIVTDDRRDIEDALEQLIRQGQQSGAITTTQDARALAQFVFSSISGLRVVGKMNPDKKALDNIVEMIAKTLQPSREDAMI